MTHKISVTINDEDNSMILDAKLNGISVDTLAHVLVNLMFHLDKQYDEKLITEMTYIIMDELDMEIKALEQKPKGHWMVEFNDIEGEVRYTCSRCGKYQLSITDYCCNCGSENV